MKSIAFVDFDHNIYDGDSMLDFLKLAVGKRAYQKAFLKSLHIILGYKLKFVSGHKAKEYLFKYTIRNKSVKLLESSVEQFTAQIELKLFAKAKQELSKHAENQVEIVIVSASSPLWLKPWCDGKGYVLLATELELVGGVFTGRLAGANCKGVEKVRKIKSAFRLEEFDKIYCYGDDKSDIPMLKLANQAIVNLFD